MTRISSKTFSSEQRKTPSRHRDARIIRMLDPQGWIKEFFIKKKLVLAMRRRPEIRRRSAAFQGWSDSS
jgi:hypothetical protein